MKPIIKELAEKWAASGVHEGDLLLLHSDIKRTLWDALKNGHDIAPHDILESFLHVLGDSGTLIVPTFSFDFAQGKSYNILETPSDTGILSETVRLDSRSTRTGHPIFSFAAIGRQASELGTIDNFSAFGEHSPFEYLHKNGGKIAFLDCIPGMCTYLHYIEESNDSFINYRYHKEFSGQYINNNGESKIKTYNFFVRDLNKKVVPHFAPAENEMWKYKLYSGDRTGVNSGLSVINALELYNFVTELIINGDTENMLYRIEGKEYE
ncbi:MAG: AAC(3) family N-acetyltransferase [Fibrobacterales bacterium]